MSKFLVHIHTGRSDPTKAALGFLVAATALKEGHEVSLFLAGDGVELIGEAALAELEGLGTGRLADHYEALKSGGAQIYLSAKSARARGWDDAALRDKPAQFAMPPVLIRLAAEADVVLTY